MEGKDKERDEKPDKKLNEEVQSQQPTRERGSNPGLGPITIGWLLPMSLTIMDARFYMFKDKDFWMLAEIESHPDVMRWNIETYKGDKAEMYRAFKEAVEKLQVDKDKIFLVGRCDGEVVGFVGVRSINEGLEHVGEVGISVHPNHWGRGFGTSLLKAAVEKAKAEGFAKLKLETISSNKAMLRVAQKVGFKVKNVEKREAFDIVFMELTF